MIENSLGINYCGNNCYNENLTILPREKERERNVRIFSK